MTNSKYNITTTKRYGSIYSRKRPNRFLNTMGSWGPMIFFPLMFGYLEVIFHVYMNMDLKYLSIYLLFGISFGFILSIFTMIFPRRVNKIIALVLSFLGCLFYCVEMECKMILQSYYQLLSSAETAANNNLLDYKDAIIQGIFDHIGGIFLFLLPFILLLILSFTIFKYHRVNLVHILMPAVLGIIFHVFALGTLHFSWSGDKEYLPKTLYNTDTNVEDQVEKLGVVTMLRLDIKHSLFGAGSSVDLDEDFSSVHNSLSSNQAKEPGSSPNTSASAPSSTDDVAANSNAVTIDTSPNIMNINLEELANAATNDDVKWLNKYFNSVTPTNKNQYTGMFKGYNVIFITAEGFSGYLIDEKLTPTLYKLTHEGFVFNNFYSPLHFTSTSGGEFQNLVGLYPKNGNPISMSYTGKNKTWLPFTLANQLNNLGYNSEGYHCNVNMYGRDKSHPNLGYNWHQEGSGVTMEKTSSNRNIWPQSDEYLMKQTVDNYLTKNDPFNIYYMSISGHLPYNFTGDQMAVRNKDAVASLPYSDKTKAYVAANLELEKSLAYLIEQLEATGKLNNTVICMAPDHIPYSDADILEELAGKNFGGEQLENLNEKGVDFDIYKNSLIIWSGSMKEPVVVDKLCSQVDILPTLSNLLGLEYDSRLLVGTDILSDASPLVVFSSGCFKTDKGFYNRYKGEFTLADGVSMTEEEQSDYVSAMKKIVRYKRTASELILTTNYYNTIPELKRN